ncbi:cytochrome c oxidase subunit 7c, partial [Phenoliferia sp. Uapishka_3]
MISPVRTLALRAVRPSPSPLLRRSMHIDNVVGNNTPFSYANPKVFGAKIVVFCITGFSIPFVAVKYQLSGKK